MQASTSGGVTRRPTVDARTLWAGGLATAVVAALTGGALVATALIHLLLISTPRPFAFFGWIVTLVTALAAIMPFTSDASTESKIATAVIVVVIGIAIGTLVSGVARRALRGSPA